MDDYSGERAAEYESARSDDPKWKFEEDALVEAVSILSHEIQSIIDAPVGTGRFLEKYTSIRESIQIIGIDYSDDMLNIARRKNSSANIRFIEHDIINKYIPVEADLVVCFRFLNLVCTEAASMSLSNLMRSAKKYILFSIRTVPDYCNEEKKIENKIYLHKISDIDRVIVANHFATISRVFFSDTRRGHYSVILCRRLFSV